MNTQITLQDGSQIDLANVVRYAYENLGELCIRMNDGKFVTVSSPDEIGWITYLLGEYKRKNRTDNVLVERIKTSGYWY